MERIRHCITLQHIAAHCSTLQHTATHCNTLQLIETHRRRPKTWTIVNTLQHTATHCNTLQNTATHCNTPQYTGGVQDKVNYQHTATHCNTLQHTATHCKTLHHTAPHCNTQLQPRRTLRMIFWSAEEIGSLGGKSYFESNLLPTETLAIAIELDFGIMNPSGHTTLCCSVLQCVVVCRSVL